VSGAAALRTPDSPDSLDARVATLRTAAGEREGLDLLAWILGPERPAGQIALVSSFGAESAVLLDMVARAAPATPVVFLNTGKLFGATLAYREALVERLRLTDVRDVRPDMKDVARHDPDGTLWSLEPDMCCHIRKTEPLDAALDGFDGWITGRKRFHGGARAALPVIEGDAASGRFKINPIASWTPDGIARYLSERELPTHPLVDEGYDSIGCVPCTRARKPGEPPRAGRWSWLDKSECGIHGDGI